MLCLLLTYTSTFLSFAASLSSADNHHFLFLKTFPFVVMAMNGLSLVQEYTNQFGYFVVSQKENHPARII